MYSGDCRPGKRHFKVSYNFKSPRQERGGRIEKEYNERMLDNDKGKKQEKSLTASIPSSGINMIK